MNAPAISATAAMMAANAYAHAHRHGGPVDALGEIARLCAWASGEAIAVSLVAAVDRARERAESSVERVAAPKAANGDDLVAEILGRATAVPADAERISDTIATPTTKRATTPRGAARKPAWTKR